MEARTHGNPAQSQIRYARRSAAFCACDPPGATFCYPAREVRINRTVLLASTALLALATAGTATEGKPSPTFFITQSLRVLWNQNSNDSGNSVNSQVLTSNYTSASAFSAADDFVIPKSSTSNFSYSDEAADNFVVPRGKTWRIKEVDVTGIYYNGSGKVAGHAPFLQNVIFYKNRRGMPGKRLRGFRYRNGGAGPNLTIPLRHRNQAESRPLLGFRNGQCEVPGRGLGMGR